MILGPTAQCSSYQYFHPYGPLLCVCVLVSQALNWHCLPKQTSHTYEIIISIGIVDWVYTGQLYWRHMWIQRCGDWESRWQPCETDSSAVLAVVHVTFDPPGDHSHHHHHSHTTLHRHKDREDHRMAQDWTHLPHQRCGRKYCKENY